MPNCGKEKGATAFSPHREGLAVGGNEEVGPDCGKSFSVTKFCTDHRENVADTVSNL